MTGIGEACRCGAYGNRDGMPCYMCWDHTADEPLLRLMLDKARRRQGNAFPNLMKLGDPSCAPILRRLLDDPDPGMRQLAVVALGWSGDAADVALVGRLALDDVDRVRMAALATLAELGGPNAGEVLWRCAQGRTGRERQLALRALAWLADPRARPALLESMPDWLGVEDSQDHAKALLRVAEPQDLDALVEWVQQAAHLIGTGQISPERLKQAFEAVHQAVAAVMPERLENMANRLRDVPELLVDLGYYWMGRIHARRPAGPRPLAVPLGDRLVPSQPLIYGMQAPASDGEPLAKFRGQPQWRAEPTWPIGPHGPLAFYGQLPLAEHRTAYLFVGESDSWQPLGPGNALVVQPGPLPHLPTQPMRQGPQIYEWRPETPARFRRRARRLPAPEIPVALIDWTDPPAWDWSEDQNPSATLDVRPAPDRDIYWNKLGGTPLWLQSPHWPPGEGWSFAFQFSAARAGQELGDAAECYGFVHQDGRGAFLWQCH